MMNYGFPWNWNLQNQNFWQSSFVLPFIPFILPLVIFEIVLKGFALWYAARNGQKYWFIAMLFINTAGILPLVYLLFFQKKITSSTTKSSRR